MNADLKQLVTFHRTGKRPGGSGNGAATLRPALLSGFRDLTKLRYDYPVVLVEGQARLRSLTDIVNDLLRDVAPKGASGERMRKNVLALETEIRRLVASGEGETLSLLWRQAANHLLDRANDSADGEALRANLAKARKALSIDGAVVDCNEQTAVKLVAHLYAGVQAAKNREVLADLKALTVKLSGILEADYRKTAEAQKAEAFKASVGHGFSDEIDFEAFSAVLTGGRKLATLSKARRERIAAALETLESQRFFDRGDNQAYSFVLDSAPAALEAYTERLPEMAAFMKAVRIAQLEIDNEYDEATHDAYFEGFDAGSLKAEHIAVFPSYLVVLTADRFADAEKARAMEILASDLPIKLLVQADDVASSRSLVDGQPAWDGWHMQLAGMAVGLTTAYVLQSGCSHLYRNVDGLLAGLRYEGPAVLSVFTGAAMRANGLPTYLVSASAVQARAFASFVYDPSAGDDLASRFRLQGNPQAELTWPVNVLTYEDDDLQRVTEQVAFSFADFAVCDERHAEDFLLVGRDRWNDAMVPAAELVSMPPAEARGKLPYILVVDGENRLQRAVVSEPLTGAARRTVAIWRGLQELGGLNSSHAQRLLERERAVWEEEKRQEIEALQAKLGQPAVAPAAKSAGTAAQAAAEAVVVEVEAEAPPSGEPYIETPRCNSCNECITINGRMFAYNADKQATLVDPTAGTYRQLVEAAEKCQVAIIHPGKPKNPDEPGLDELIERAAAFK